MHFAGLNLAAVLVAAIATMVIGFLWYSPLLFANPWMRAMGYDPNDKVALAKMQKSAGKLYGLSFLTSLLTAAVLAKMMYAIGYPPGTALLPWAYFLRIAIFAWFGFVMTVQFTNTLFGMKPIKLFLIDTGYQLVCYAAMGAILGVWP
jgi:hypothetical protein